MRHVALTSGSVQEPGGANIVTYPRVLEGIVRKKDDRRKAQREAAAKRKAAEAAAMAEQVKRLKSAKRREIDERQAPLTPERIHPWLAYADVCQCR